MLTTGRFLEAEIDRSFFGNQLKDGADATRPGLRQNTRQALGPSLSSMMASAEANSVATCSASRVEPKMLVAEVCNRILGRPRAQRGSFSSMDMNLHSLT
ncbi:hypothetical protein [Burkholderia sp. WSM2232]|uniref:hypothetical protein n=1 Tax=Burkholderia sp. WSM2232 TaxID=944436 RepID=UPI0012ECAB5F|nr:hypothetical protein [Burkholderia sp. WSM2232]